jgi:hypothetical protein
MNDWNEYLKTHGYDGRQVDTPPPVHLQEMGLVFLKDDSPLMAHRDSEAGNAQDKAQGVKTRYDAIGILGRNSFRHCFYARMQSKRSDAKILIHTGTSVTCFQISIHLDALNQAESCTLPIARTRNGHHTFWKEHPRTLVAVCR